LDGPARQFPHAYADPDAEQARRKVSAKYATAVPNA
jgi:hypothetical protein